MLRKFFYLAAGMCLLTLSYNLGARQAVAQGAGNPVIAACQTENGAGMILPIAITANGNVYRSDNQGTTWQLVGNVGGGATGVPSTSFGALKARYR